MNAASHVCDRAPVWLALSDNPALQRRTTV
jgi:hypothetical protein